MTPTEGKIYKNLTSIRPENKNLSWKNIRDEEYLLVVSLKQNISFYKPYLDSTFYNTGAYQIWVTAAPDLQQRMKQEKYKDKKYRLKELLGLPPESEYNYFVEFWVRPSDLFRPCPDREISDRECSLCFPENTDANYIRWINDNRISRYYQCSISDKYPWTQLGYTYDWNKKNKSHVGLSEFVIESNRNIAVNAIYTIDQYLNK